MNPDTIHDAVATLPPLASRFRPPTSQQQRHRWNPENLPGYELSVAQLLKIMREGDELRYPPGTRSRHFGVPLLRLFREIFDPEKPDPFGVTAFGGVAFQDPEGIYETFTRTLIAELLRRAPTDRRLLWATGGGPGFTMTRTCEIFLEIADEMRTPRDRADVFQVLADIRKETPNEVAQKHMTARPQAGLDERFKGLIVPAEVALCYPFGLGGTDEIASQLLQNQLFGIEGPIMIGPRLIVLLDSQLPAGKLRRFGLDSKMRWFDWVEALYERFVVGGTAAATDFTLLLRVHVDEDPVLAGRTVAEDIIAFDRFRGGQRTVEVEAIRGALASL